MPAATLSQWNLLIFFIKENFKIEKLNSSCNVSLASHDNCLKAHNYIKFELEIIDEFGTSDKLEIKGVIVPIKYSIIIGFPFSRFHNHCIQVSLYSLLYGSPS